MLLTAFSSITGDISTKLWDNEFERKFSNAKKISIARINRFHYIPLSNIFHVAHLLQKNNDVSKIELYIRIFLPKI